MSTFMLLTRLNSGSTESPRSFESLEKHTMTRVRQVCPNVQWVASYAALGPYDYVDVFRADDIEMATKLSALIRSTAHVHTEVWPVMEWSSFKEMMHEIPE